MKKQLKQKATSVGRPRNDKRPPLTKNQILLASAKLFSENGYSGTSIRDICKELKVHPGSIFNHFESKELILEKVCEFFSSKYMDFYQKIQAVKGSPAVLLYKCLYEDVKVVSSDEAYVRGFMRIPEVRSGKFEKIQGVFGGSVKHYQELIALGMEEGVFHKRDLSIISECVTHLTETSMYYSSGSLHPEEQAREVASFVLGGLIADPGLLKDIIAEADNINIYIEEAHL